MSVAIARKLKKKIDKPLTFFLEYLTPTMLGKRKPGLAGRRRFARAQGSS